MTLLFASEPLVTPGLPCAYKLSAMTWNALVNLGMNQGHNAEMAATSLRFFRDPDDPADYQLALALSTI